MIEHIQTHNLADHLVDFDYIQSLMQQAVQLPEGHFVDIGTRAGGTAMLALDVLKNSPDKFLFTIDPYGDKPYPVGSEATGISTYPLDYGEQHYRTAMKELSQFAYSNNLNHVHYRTTSEWWIKNHYQVFYKGDFLEDTFAFVYLDGEHTDTAVAMELDYFMPRMVKGGVIVVDDAHFIAKSNIESVRAFISQALLREDRYYLHDNRKV